MRRLARFLALSAAAALVSAAPAGAQSDIYRDFSDDGQINPCDYSKGELQRGLRGLPPDLEQYAPGIGDQLRRPCARSGAPAQGGEDDAGAATAAPGRPPAARPEVDIPRPPAPRPAADRSIDAPVVAFSSQPTGADAPGWLIALLALLGIGGLAALAARYAGGFTADDVVRPLRARFSR